VELERTSHRSLVVLVLVSGLFVALLVSAMSSKRGGATYIMVDELVEKGLDQFRGQDLKVHGWVVPGSIQRHDGGWATFVIERHGKRLRVRADGPMPDTFCDGREVVVVGTLHRDVLEASDVLAKCPSKYEGARDRPCGGSVMLFE
jgi:cytochrome c-type biogenesis protein CcmE